MGLIFFRYHKIEYSYPALAAMITRRKAQTLYKRYDFDIDEYTGLQSHCLRLERQLVALQPPRTMLSTEQARILSSDLAQLKQIRQLREAQISNSGKSRGADRERSFTASDSY